MASIQQVTVPPRDEPPSSNVIVQVFMGGPGGILASGPWKTLGGLTSMPGQPYDSRTFLGRSQQPGGNGYNIAYPAGVGTHIDIFRTIAGPVDAQAPVGSPMTTSPNLDVNFDAWGNPIPLMMGHVRLGGSVTFAQGLEVGTSAAARAFIDLEVSFGYALDPNEWQWIECVGIWANGNKIFGGSDDLPGLSFTFYEGKEDSPIAPEVLADKGAARATGMRGMRRIVFNQFPIGVLGGGIPTFSAEFAMTKDAPAPLISVADVLKKIHLRGGVVLSTESNFDDEADGVVFMSDVAPVSLARDLMATYNYLIKDGNGASLSRRAVNNDLVIDGDPLDVDDMVTESDDEDPITFERNEQSETPNIIAITYTDVDLAFTNNIQVAKRSIFPFRQTLSDMRSSVQLPFSTDAVTVLKLDYDQLYRGWTEALKGKFKSSDIRIEVGDVKHIVGHELGDYIVRITKSNIRLDKVVVNELECVPLLKRTGVEVNADSGDYITDTIIKALNYPDVIVKPTGLSSTYPYMGHPIIVGSAICTSALVFGSPSSTYGSLFASTSIPAKVSRGALSPSKTVSPDGVVTTGPRLKDASYVYVIDHGRCGIQRINKNNISDSQYLDLTGSVAALPANGNQYSISGGYIYWGDKSPGGGGDKLKAYRLDTALFSASGLTVLALDSDTTTFTCIGSVVVGTSCLLTAFDRSHNDSRLYDLDLTDPDFTTFSYTSLTDGPAAGQGFLGRGVSDGGTNAFFLPLEAHDGAGNFDDTSANKDPQIWGAKIDMSGTGSPAVTWFNLTDDANVTLASKGDCDPWIDKDNLYFLANSNHSSPYDQYLAARKLSDLSVVAGFDLSSIYDDRRFDFFQGATDGSFHYIIGTNYTDNAGAILKVEQDLSAGELFYRGVSEAPDNDNFKDAAPLTLNTTVTADNIKATKEVGEPNHNGNAGGSSIWYVFTCPPGTSSVKLDANATPIIVPEIAVYTGTEVGALTSVAANSISLTFSVTAGVRYRIAIDGQNGATGVIKFSFTDVT